MKKLISLFLILSQAAFAGGAPTSIQPQSGSKASASFFEVPYNQATSLGGINTLIETGNTNTLVNPSFENATVATGWTAGSGVASAVNTSIYFDGKQAVTLTFTSTSAGETLWYQDVTPGSALTAVNGLASLAVNSSLSGSLEVCPRSGGTTTTTACTPLTIASTWQQLPANFIFPSSGSSGIALVGISAISSGTAAVDKGYLGIATNIGSSPVVTARTAYTPTFTGFGTVTALSAFSWTVGDTLYVSGTFNAGTSTATAASISLPSGSTIDTSKISSSSVGTQVGRAAATNTSSAVNTTSGDDAIAFFDGSTTGSIFISQASASGALTKVNGSTFVATGNGVTFDFKVPVLGASGGTSYTSNLPTQPQVTVYTSGSGTYTVPAGASRLEIKMAGAGGGGGGSGTSAGNGGAGGNTTFGTSLLVANGGSGGIGTPAAAGVTSGGTASLGTGPIGIAITGGSGGMPGRALSTDFTYGGAGGQNAFSGGAPSSASAVAGSAGIANTGGGGGGAASAQAVTGGNGGGAGGYIDAIITSNSSAWATSFSYSVGSAGTAGTAGTGTLPNAGGAGGSGVIYITAYFGNQPIQFVGQVSSNTSGQEHIERATVAGSGSPSISSQSGSWLTFTTRNNAGDYTYTITSGEFSATPTCWANVQGTNNAGMCSVYSVSSTSLRVLCGYASTTGGVMTSADYNQSIGCMGPH